MRPTSRMSALRRRLAALTPLERLWLALALLLLPIVLVCMVLWPLAILGFFRRG